MWVGAGPWEYGARIHNTRVFDKLYGLAVCPMDKDDHNSSNSKGLLACVCLRTARQYHCIRRLGLGFCSFGRYPTTVVYQYGNSKFPWPSLNRERYSVV